MYKTLIVGLTTLALPLTSNAQSSVAPTVTISAQKHEAMTTTFLVEELNNQETQKLIEVRFGDISTKKIISKSVDVKRREVTVVYSTSFGTEEVKQLLTQCGAIHPIELKKTAPEGKRYLLNSDGSIRLTDI